MSRRKDFRQSNWLIELSPRKNVELRIVGIRSTFRGSTFFRLVEIRLKDGFRTSKSLKYGSQNSNFLLEMSIFLTCNDKVRDSDRMLEQ